MGPRGKLCISQRSKIADGKWEEILSHSNQTQWLPSPVSSDCLSTERKVEEKALPAERDAILVVLDFAIAKHRLKEVIG